MNTYPWYNIAIAFQSVIEIHPEIIGQICGIPRIVSKYNRIPDYMAISSLSNRDEGKQFFLCEQENMIEPYNNLFQMLDRIPDPKYTPQQGTYPKAWRFEMVQFDQVAHNNPASRMTQDTSSSTSNPIRKKRVSKQKKHTKENSVLRESESIYLQMYNTLVGHKIAQETDKSYASNASRRRNTSCRNRGLEIQDLLN